MKAPERDELLIRLDEKTNNIWNLTEKQEQHLDRLNSSLSDHAVQIAQNKTSIKWIVRVLSAGGLIGGAGTGVSKLLGLW